MSSSTIPRLAACASMLAPWVVAGVARPDAVVEVAVPTASSPTDVGTALAACCPAPLAGVPLPAATEAGDNRTLGTARSLLPLGPSSLDPASRASPEPEAEVFDGPPPLSISAGLGTSELAAVEPAVRLAVVAGMVVALCGRAEGRAAAMPSAAATALARRGRTALIGEVDGGAGEAGGLMAVGMVGVAAEASSFSPMMNVVGMGDVEVKDGRMCHEVGCWKEG